jgi:preprotein translocase subunit SecG
MGGLGVFGGVAVIVAIFAAVFGLIYWLAGLPVALATFFALVAGTMILVVLIQKPRGGGLSGAFGGAGGPQQTAFGAKVGDVLTWVTVGAFVMFLGLAMSMKWVLAWEADAKAAENEKQAAPADAGGASPEGDSQG